MKKKKKKKKKTSGDSTKSTEILFYSNQVLTNPFFIGELTVCVCVHECSARRQVLPNSSLSKASLLTAT